MPILGASKVAWAGSAPLYGTQANPITSDAEGASWATTNGGVSGVAYVQKAGLNGGNPYQTYLVYTSNKLWVMAAVYQAINDKKLNRNDILSESVENLNKSFNIASDEAELQSGTIKMTVGDALDKAVTLSDNYSALLLTKKLGIPTIN